MHDFKQLAWEVIESVRAVEATQAYSSLEIAYIPRISDSICLDCFTMVAGKHYLSALS